MGLAAATNNLRCDVHYQANDQTRAQAGWINCDASGDIRYLIAASGANTLDVWISILGYVLGE